MLRMRGLRLSNSADPEPFGLGRFVIGLFGANNASAALRAL
jgi:hypothetical protein